MPGIKRDRSRVKIIDDMIRTEYPANGPDYVAERLGEDRQYIMTRAHYLKVRQNVKPVQKKPKQKPSRADLEKRIKVLESQNKALRGELIKLVDERRRYA